ncbi:hypothetical protein PR003_g4117 [Phytophthora rubi]|uniref:Uncharacterized protein n=1 Tax=Phytophthora rubi TaxID=129364 RepID=A0A6A4FN53_9STRA|nr:hypothetical protein PR003_g4117 [Phytophthora rubi]
MEGQESEKAVDSEKSEENVEAVVNSLGVLETQFLCGI